MVWGLTFLVPTVLEGYSPLLITFGRFAAHGLLSCILSQAGPGLRALGREAWKAAAAFALLGNIGYDVVLVQGIRQVGAPLVALITGPFP
ncbi:hypothetical protein METESE_09540 [Mesoterricola sediminis]|uniref:EamA domain-containing protein n=2 Tax=Mesoterricola sediminis TaxID=2927980 RepID=A0AA48KBM4_9BACT|nr:hypothetical protein METESE_09540 [Mesoterricola sediminis]